jgi:hypothetical protein
MAPVLREPACASYILPPAVCLERVVRTGTLSRLSRAVLRCSAEGCFGHSDCVSTLELAGCCRGSCLHPNSSNHGDGIVRW